jgi:hypothetical protein
VESDIDLEVVNSYTTDLSGIHNIITVDDKSTWVNDCNKEVIRQINIDNDNIILLSVVTWIPQVNKDDDTEKNSFISPDFVKSFISELLPSDRSMSLFEVNVMSKISQEICYNIIVGVKEPGILTPTDESIRTLLIFDMDGKQQHTYQYDSNTYRLFTLPRRITTNNNKVIFPDFVKSFISEL